MGKIKIIILVYLLAGIAYMALLHFGFISLEVGNVLVNILFYIFFPIAILYTIIMAMFYGMMMG